MTAGTNLILMTYSEDQLSQMIETAVSKALEKAQPKQDTEKYLTREETAKRCAITLATLNNWVNVGKIIAHKINGRVLFKQTDIEKAMIARKTIKY
ncbi:MAG: helix-turn-helix domain-containing protein [Dysgonomonas mossii]